MDQRFDYEALHRLYSGTWMLNNGYTKELVVEAITSGRADIVSFGRPFITNPDLVRRFRKNDPLNNLFEDAPLYGGSGRTAISIILRLRIEHRLKRSSARHAFFNAGIARQYRALTPR